MAAPVTGANENRVIVAQVGAERGGAGQHPLRADALHGDAPVVDRAADGDRAVMTRQAELRRTRRQPDRRLHRRARVRLVVGRRRERLVPQRRGGIGVVRGVAEDADLGLGGRLHGARAGDREIVLVAGRRHANLARGGRGERDDRQDCDCERLSPRARVRPPTPCGDRSDSRVLCQRPHGHRPAFRYSNTCTRRFAESATYTMSFTIVMPVGSQNCPSAAPDSPNTSSSRPD